MHRRPLARRPAWILASILLLTTASMATGLAYHIQGNPYPLAGPSGSLTSADWEHPDAPRICESDGPLDPRNAQPVPTPGTGGLCTTGENAATGVPAPAVMPSPGQYIRLDVCDALTATVTGRGPGKPCQDGQSQSLGGGPGRTDSHGWQASIGAFSCFIPTDNTVLDLVLGNLLTEDYALYYDRVYAWWSFTGTGSGAGHHGHVSAFVDTLDSEAGASRSGSIETSLFTVDTGNPAGANPTAATWPAGELPHRTHPNMLLADNPATTPWGVSNNCGSSTSLPPGSATDPAGYGPVFRAPYDVTQWT